MFNGELKKWRKEIFKRDNYTCTICNVKGQRINAHHIYSWDKYKERRFDINNGVTLCHSCHKDFHKNYGYGNNNMEQFTEYKNNKK